MNRSFRMLRNVGAALSFASLTFLYSCTDHRTPPDPKPNYKFYGLTTNNKLIEFSTQSPESPRQTIDIKVPAGEKVLGIDFRPATGQLYAVTDNSRLYSINLGASLGTATPVGTAPFVALDGTEVGFDFNPTVDRIRLVTNKGQNLRLHPETGELAATDTPIPPSSGTAISAVAYTNSVGGATSTALYDLDPVTDRLYKQDPPNNGTLVPIGSLGIDVTKVGGFDIAPDNSIAIASVQIDGKWELTKVDIGNGSLKKLGDFNEEIIGIALAPKPVAYAIDAANNDLLIFDPNNPAALVSKPVLGLLSGENLLGIDFRPANGQLYALGSTGRVLTVNLGTGALTQVGNNTLALMGTSFGFDFNPVADRLRVISDLGQNLRINVAVAPTAALGVTRDSTINPSAPKVTAAAYTNNYAGTTTTALYDIAPNTNSLYLQTPPNDGKLVLVGSTTVLGNDSNGFDIGGTSGLAFAILSTGGVNVLYRVDLTTGKATQNNVLPKAVRGFAIGLGF